MRAGMLTPSTTTSSLRITKRTSHGTPSRAVSLCGVLLICVLSERNFALASDRLLTLRVPSFEFHGNSPRRGHVVAESPGDVPEAALNLAIHAHVRMAIEGLPGPRLPIEIRAKSGTIEEILQRMIEQDARYEYVERLGVIEVRPVGAAGDPGDCLNMVIPKFEVHYSWEIAWGQVRCEIRIISQNPNDIVPDPLTVGRCWGSSHLPATPPKILSANFEHRTVRDILDTLASMAGNVAWYLPSKVSAPNCRALEQTIAEYAPTTMYRRRNAPKLAFTEKPPGKCLKCHYHRPVRASSSP